MTVAEKIVDNLVKMGLSDGEAKEVFVLAKPELDGTISNYNITWDRPHDEYSDVLYAIWMMSIKEIGLQWIEDNCPQAWFKPMFQPLHQ